MNDSLERKVDEILFHIKSDPSTGHIGMAEQTHLNTEDIRLLKTNEKIKTRVSIALGGAAGLFVSNIGNIIKFAKFIL